MNPGTKLAAIAAMFGVFGAAKLPVERALDAERKAARIDDQPVMLSLRDQLGQNLMLAILGGFRSLVATILDLQAFEEMHRENFGAVESKYRLIHLLRPRDAFYWDAGAQALMRNATHYYRGLDEAVTWRNANRVAFDAYVDKGRGMLEEGIRNLPEDYRLREALAMSWEDRHLNEVPDYARSSEVWRGAMECPRAPERLGRFHAYAVARQPGREQEAWMLLKQLHDKGSWNRLPTLVGLLKQLEVKLNIPAEQRIPAPGPGR